MALIYVRWLIRGNRDYIYFAIRALLYAIRAPVFSTALYFRYSLATFTIRGLAFLPSTISLDVNPKLKYIETSDLYLIQSHFLLELPYNYS